MMRPRTTHWGIFSLFLGAALLTGCSKSAKSMRALRKAEALKERGDTLFGEGSGDGAREAYGQSVALTKRVLEWNEDRTSSLARKAAELQRLVSHRQSACEKPEGAFLCLVDALQAGNAEDVVLFMDMEAMAKHGTGEEKWNGLDAQSKEIWLGCLERILVDWMEEEDDYFRSLQLSVKDRQVEGNQATIVTEWVSTVAEVEIVFGCWRRDGVWRVCDFDIPSLESGLVRYLQAAVKGMEEEASSLQAFLERENVEEESVRVFRDTSYHIPALENSLIGKMVEFKENPATYYVVCKQRETQEGEWVQICPKDADPSEAVWVQKSKINVIKVEEDLWAVQ